MVRLTISRR
jgi:hypothetical protein